MSVSITLMSGTVPSSSVASLWNNLWRNSSQDTDWNIFNLLFSNFKRLTDCSAQLWSHTCLSVLLIFLIGKLGWQFIVKMDIINKSCNLSLAKLYLQIFCLNVFLSLKLERGCSWSCHVHLSQWFLITLKSVKYPNDKNCVWYQVIRLSPMCGLVCWSVWWRRVTELSQPLDWREGNTSHRHPPPE